MPNLKLIGRLCLSEEGEIVYLPVSHDTRYKEEVYQTDQPDDVVVPLSQADINAEKEAAKDLSLTGVLDANKKRAEAAPTP